jgi:hypothetical protein
MTCRDTLAQHTPAYVSIRQHTLKQHASIRLGDVYDLPRYACPADAPAYVGIRQHTQHTLKQHASIRLGDVYDLPRYARPADAPAPRPPA